METSDVGNDAFIATVVRKTLACAVGVAEVDICEGTRLYELGIDSLMMMSVGVVLEAELDIHLSDEIVLQLFSAEDVAEMTEIVCVAMKMASRVPPRTSTS